MSGDCFRIIMASYFYKIIFMAFLCTLRKSPPHLYFASFGTSLMLKLMRPILSFPRHTTFTTSPSVRTSSTRLILSLAILEMCTIPSLPGANSRKAPKSLMLMTLPVENLSLLEIGYDDVDRSTCFLHTLAASVPQIDTAPSSEISIFTPVSR